MNVRFGEKEMSTAKRVLVLTKEGAYSMNERFGEKEMNTANGF
jgi:hypothetical protein